MERLILSAIPFFLLTIGLEVLVLRHVAVEGSGGTPKGWTPKGWTPKGWTPKGYRFRDSQTSITMGLGHLGIGAVWKLVWAAALAAIYVNSPVQLPTDAWWTWVVLFFVDDLAYYAYHRAHHRVRLFWATHVVHHSSEHYNLSTALRQDWSPFTATLFWLPSALFFPPWMVFLAIGWNLLYQFTLHTEAIDKYPRPIEFVFNTPSHHRVHHGSQQQYLDRNYGGILIIWDRLFGTFEPERERVRYGLTKNIGTYNPVRVAFGEFAAIWRDVRQARDYRARLGFLFGGPGWQPAPPAEPRTAANPSPVEAKL